MNTNIVLGPVERDQYVSAKIVQPGGGTLHNAYHLQKLGQEPLLLTRFGQADGQIFTDFLTRHQISFWPEVAQVAGESAAIDIVILPSGDAQFPNYKTGVWGDLRLTTAEETIIAQSEHLQMVLVGLLPELTRIGQQGVLEKPLVSADLLSFELSHDAFKTALPFLDLIFIGWRESLAHATVQMIRQAIAESPTVAVLTLGSRGVQVYDSRSGVVEEHFFPVTPIAVTGTTNGCGDAFISYFLAEYWRSGDLAAAVAQGHVGGKATTQWLHALPEDAYQT